MRAAAVDIEMSWAFSGKLLFFLVTLPHPASA
jgi:hypothetical protein